MVTRRTVWLSALGMLTASRVRAQPARATRRVGLIFFSTQQGWAPYREAFVQRMRELGWEEGRSVTYRSVYANGDVTKLKALTNDLLKEQIDAILVSDSPTAHAARVATSTVPIVFVGLSNVVGNGYVETLARPGGNVKVSRASSKKSWVSSSSFCTPSFRMRGVWRFSCMRTTYRTLRSGWPPKTPVAP